MENRIRHIAVRNRSLMPAQAEVWITVVPEWQTPATEVRGRLMGPHCPYANTVEVAYALRPVPHERADGLTMRVVIPEASLWEPQCPFLYRGPVELWQDGRLCERVELRHGLRSVGLSERGLLVNGRPLRLHGRSVSACTDEEALRLRQAGCNLLIVPVEAESLPIWERADRLGFLVLGRLKDVGEKTLSLLPALSRHTSCLGWLVEKRKPSFLDLLPSDHLLGLIGEEGSPPLSPEGIDFLFGSAESAHLGLPLLVKGEASAPPSGCPILGCVV
jgi:hypothetical protein